MKNIFLGAVVCVVAVTFIIFPNLSHAQETCGSIIEYYDYGDGNGLVIDSETLIEDCANPFGAVTENPNIRISYGTTEISRNIAYPFIGMTEAFVLEGTHPEATSIMLNLYKTVPEGYERINVNSNGKYTFITPGTYTVVVTEDALGVGQNFLQRILASIIPIAYAFPGVSSVVTFTVTELVEEPTGASSVLFLPGIMGSRLYEMSSACDSEVDEQERWVSSDECDQLRMETNVVGTSINDIYTRQGEEGLVQSVTIFNMYTAEMYKAFVNRLKEWKHDTVIKDFIVAPYDWRLRLDDILKTKIDSDGKIVYDAETLLTESYLYTSLQSLADDSLSGKVTVVAHSNGGLLIKQFVTALLVMHDPLLQKIDNIVFVASPQSGAPESVIGILHGTELEFVMKQDVTRQIMNTAPFAHHLLPSPEYFNTVTTPVITFEEGESTNAWRSAFGATINSADMLYDFLSKESGRVKPESDDLATPEIVDGYLLGYADTISVTQDYWNVPDNITVYEIAGTGIETPSGITYFTDRECVARNPFKLFACTEYASKLGYRADMVVDGDGTVLVPSALALSESDTVKRLWLNLRNYNRLNSDRRHRDILEVPDIIDFIGDVVKHVEEATYTYLTDIESTIPEGDRLVFQLHSPLDMSLVTQDGGVVSSSTNTIADSVYRRYGELQYISVPHTITNAELKLTGYATGSFTLEVEDTMTSFRRVYSAIPTSTSTKAVLTFTSSEVLADTTIELDYDGNGTTDVLYDESGIVEPEVTYDTLFQTIEELTLKKHHKRMLVHTAKMAQAFHDKWLHKKGRHVKLYNVQETTMLNMLMNEVQFYARLKLITFEQKAGLEEIIGKLLGDIKT